MDEIDVQEYDEAQRMAEMQMPPLTWPVDSCGVIIAPRNGDRLLWLHYRRIGACWVFVDYENI